MELSYFRKKSWREAFYWKNKKINSVVFEKTAIFFTSGREEIVETRIKRIKESAIKLEIARKIIKTLFIVPMVLFVGISGNLSMLNSQKEDDIDLL